MTRRRPNWVAGSRLAGSHVDWIIMDDMHTGVDLATGPDKTVERDCATCEDKDCGICNGPPARGEGDCGEGEP